MGHGPCCSFLLDLAAADHVMLGVMDARSFCVGKTSQKDREVT